MADETSRRYLFVAIGRATRWVFIRIFKPKTAANARRFLRDLERACAIRRGAGNHAAPPCLALQPAAPTISPRQQVAIASHEGMAQPQAAAVQEAALPPFGMR